LLLVCAEERSRRQIGYKYLLLGALPDLIILQQMIYRQRQACAPLQRFTESLWFYQDLDVDHTKEKLLPNGTLELIIDLSPTPKKLYDRRDTTRFTTFRRAWISGLQREYIVIGAEQGASMMGVHFRTGGAAPFFDFPISELTASVIELDLIWKAELSSLRDRLLQEPEISRKFDLLEATLLKKACHRLEMDGSVDAALDALRRQPGLSLRQLAGEIGLSKKQMISRFDGRVGCTPKLTSRILRFQMAVRTIHQSKNRDWAGLAQELGYYDQPHMIHEFQDFAGLTPADYASQLTIYPDYVVLE